MMSLFTIPDLLGAHLGGWRHAGSFPKITMNLKGFIEMAQLAERGKFDGIFMADGNGVREMKNPSLFAANFPSARPGTFDPVVLMTSIAAHTSRLGLVSTATTTFDEPWFVARRFASLDHASDGRAGWNCVTASNADDALNFNRSDAVSKDARYARAEEFVDVVKGLWDSWADDAFVQDKASGRYLDPTRVRMLDHVGEHFRVAGPLNVPRTPQGQPVIFMAGQSDRGKELAARHADAMFGAGDTKETCQADYADIKGRMAKYGRDPDELKFIPGISIFVGRTAGEADDLFGELGQLITPALGVSFLSKMLFHDLSGLPLDGPLPDLADDLVGGSSVRRFVLGMARREGLTIRQTYQRVVPAYGSPVAIGDPVQVADTLEDWFRGKACDGFMISNPVMPLALRNFVDLVVPELQRRGLFRTEYTGRTLRDHMGLRPPANPYFAPRAAAAE